MPQRGTVIMGSGDVGWVGLAVTASEFLVERGYVVAGVNVRRYLSTFTSGTDHVSVDQIAQDYRTFAQYLKSRQLLRDPVTISGVSEGAALAVAAGAASANHDWVDGVLTMGLPPTAELAWHWSDVATWITRKDPNEPSFAPADVIVAIAPKPLWMVQSTRDEYVSEADYRRFDAIARAPKRLVLIDAANHRFTDWIPSWSVSCWPGWTGLQPAGGEAVHYHSAAAAQCGRSRRWTHRWSIPATTHRPSHRTAVRSRKSSRSRHCLRARRLQPQPARCACSRGRDHAPASAGCEGSSPPPMMTTSSECQ